MVGVLLLEIGQIRRHRVQSHGQQSCERKRQDGVGLEHRGRIVDHGDDDRSLATTSALAGRPSTRDISPRHAPGSVTVVIGTPSFSIRTNPRPARTAPEPKCRRR